jgi:hypothetical protein
MQTAPVIQLQISATPTLTQERLAALFERASQQGISPEAFVERAISRALEHAEQPSGTPQSPAMAA